MGFMAKMKKHGVYAALICDHCGEEIDSVTANEAFAVVAPEAVQFGCCLKHSDALIEANGSKANAVLLLTWWRSATAVLGFDAADLELFDNPPPPDARDVIAALPELERLTERPGLPTGLSLTDGLRLGFIHPMQVAEVLEACRP